MSDEKNKVDTTTEIKNSEMKKAEIKKADANVKTMEDFTSPEILYDELIASVKKYHPSTDISMIEKAYKIAYDAHEGQKRKSGEPYIIHPLCVAIILADLELDKETYRCRTSSRCGGGYGHDDGGGHQGVRGRGGTSGRWRYKAGSVELFCG